MTMLFTKQTNKFLANILRTNHTNFECGQIKSIQSLFNFSIKHQSKGKAQ